jgi:glycolate oxidase iron-sulfur subunit
MARALAEGHLEVTPDLVEHELNCLVCDACTAVCPAGVHMDPLQVVLRSALPVGNHSWKARLVRHVVFGWLFMDMRRFRLFARLLWLYQRSGLRWLAHHLWILRLLGLSDAEGLLPDLPRTFMTPCGETYASAGSNQAMVFAGCVMSTALAEIDRATVRVLQRAGYRVSNPQAQGCCGALHAHGGDLPRALELARRNIAAFEATDAPIVVNSAGCGAMLKDYTHHLRDDPGWSLRAKAFSARVRDLSEVLAPAALPVKGESGAKVVYQDACHLLHAQGISREPRALLRSIPGVEIVEIGEAGLCCGSAGVYNVTNPVQSRQLQLRKVDNILKAHPNVVVTSNPGCLLQLQSGLRAYGSNVEVRHLAEVLDQATTP